ncbi:GtrA family protein [Luteipulveratus halotolerans]|uniref:Membrane protein n=1 Tax=Luteipulveratus halotolerans TaxID=1631356 RepID=A0A0L6CJ69_9MICO|nr:GtrA family protein [Luteipulveratus halotolerans]KNX37779.1 membrane protein [Luteipulveratus halotolerans]
MPSSATTETPHLLDRVRGAVDVLWREMAKFGIVGAVCFVIDMGGFNLLANGALEDKITTAKIVSGAFATLVAWVGNRYWTFRHRRNRPVAHEVILFFVVNGIALGIAAAWLAFAHYTLDMDGRLANNVNAFIGIGLGTLFRFWTYRQFVFANEPIGEDEQQDALTTR